MKKLIFSLAGIILFIGNAFAQNDSVSISNKRVIWGIKANLSAELPSKWKDAGSSSKMFNSGFGASIGGLANIALGNNFYFEPEVGLFYEAYTYNNVEEVAPNSPYVNIGPDIQKLGVRIPVNFGYFINISDKWAIDVYTGPQLSYAFYGHAKSNEKDLLPSREMLDVFKGKYGQSRFDLGWNIGVGFPVDHFVISLEADLGITNMMRHYGTMRENRLSLGIGYYF